MERKIVRPIWENGDTKTRILCEIEVTDAAGIKNVMPAAVSEGSPDWDYLIENFSEEMDKLWEDHKTRREEGRKKQDEGRKRTEERVKQEQLFARKLEIFEIDKVKQSKNRKVKSLIRKASSEAEALIYGAVLVKEELDNEAATAETE